MYPAAKHAKHPRRRAWPGMAFSLLLSSVMLSGCSGPGTKTAQTGKDGYCLKAGKDQSYDCSKPAGLSSGPLRIRDLPIDDATLYARVDEIKRWLDAQKARLLNSNAKTGPDTAAPLIPPAPKAQAPVSTPEETLAAAIALGDRKQYKAAIDLLAQYHKLHPEDLSATLVESRLLFQDGQGEAAENLLKQQLKSHPHVAELYNNLAVIQAAKGNLGSAIATLQAAFSTDPSFARIQANLKTLYSVSASQALLPNPQQPAPKLNMIDMIPKR